MAPAARPRGPTLARRAEAFVVPGVLVAGAIVGLIFASRLGPLGWDESVYASQARAYVSDVPFDWFRFYRPPGLAVLGVLAAPTSFADLALRAIAVALGVAALGLVWVVTRQLFGSVAGLLALVAVAGMPVVLRDIGRFQNDLASAGLLLLLMLVLWDQFERRMHASPLLLVAGPLVAAAFYLRFGTLPALVAISLTSVVLWPGRLWRDRTMVAGTVVLAIALAVPHVLSAVELTGSPFGILNGAVDVANTSDPASTLLRYLGWMPRALAGIGATLLIAIGLLHLGVLGVGAVRRRRVPAELRRLTWLLLPAAVAAAMTTVVSHPEQRYMVFPVFLATAAGAGSVPVLARWAARRARVSKFNASRLGVAAVFLVLAASSTYEVRNRAILSGRPESTDLAIAGSIVRDDADGHCRLVSSLPPILGWYSRCETVQFVRNAVDNPAAAGMPVYVVFTDLDGDRANAAIVDAYRAMVADGRLRPVGTTPGGRAEIFRVVR